MGNYSKLIGSIVGGALGWLGSTYALPPELTSPNIQAAAMIILSAVATYLFPANAVPGQSTTEQPTSSTPREQ
jgi:hypothetical protein